MHIDKKFFFYHIIIRNNFFFNLIDDRCLIVNFKNFFHYIYIYHDTIFKKVSFI